MIIINQQDRTNAFNTTGWCVTNTPYPAIRGEGSGHSAFFPFAAGGLDPELWKKEGSFEDPTPSKIIKTKKGGWLLVPCNKKEAENLLFVKLVGGFRGGVYPTSWSNVDTKPFVLRGNAELLYCESSSKHCAPSLHAVIKCDPDAIVRFDWDGRHAGGSYFVHGNGDILTIPEQEVEAWLALNFPEYGKKEQAKEQDKKNRAAAQEAAPKVKMGIVIKTPRGEKMTPEETNLWKNVHQWLWDIDTTFFADTYQSSFLEDGLEYELSFGKYEGSPEATAYKAMVEENFPRLKEKAKH